jgi:hypothetical protein
VLSAGVVVKDSLSWFLKAESDVLMHSKNINMNFENA